MSIEIRLLDKSDWKAFRELRLAALADSPQAFWAELSIERAYSAEQWASFLRNAMWLVAADNGAPVGIAGLFRRAELPGEVEVIGMWVAPECRRRGVATLLLDTCQRSLDDGSPSTLSLWVTDGNDAARRCYESFGFRRTGERVALPRQPDLFEARMRLSRARPMSDPTDDRNHHKEEQCEAQPS
jgi:ribosomal protein S18 acetylase RimI-like enzyme